MTDLKALHEAGLNGDATTAKEIIQQSLAVGAVATARKALNL